MLLKKDIKIILEYKLVGIRILAAFAVALFKTPLALFGYFIVDLGTEFYKKHQDDKAKDLSEGKHKRIIENQKSLTKNLDKLKKEQKEYYIKLQAKKSSLKLLNKLINEGLIRDKDLFALAGSANYYQLFVYSVPVRKLVGNIEIQQPNRIYPLFLQELGFVRLGKNSTFFLINKDFLKEENLKNIKEFKKFLNYHFSKVRKREWEDFLNLLKKEEGEEYNKFKNKDYKELGVLQINFLLTETNMNPTNIGIVDGDIIGLASVKNNEEVNRQIFKNANPKNVHLDDVIKVRIKKVMLKLDISFLLDDLSKKDKNIIDIYQDEIKENLNVESIVGFYKINKDDLSGELKKIKLSSEKAKKISDEIIKRSNLYHDALLELGINLS